MGDNRGLGARASGAPPRPAPATTAALPGSTSSTPWPTLGVSSTKAAGPPTHHGFGLRSRGLEGLCLLTGAEAVLVGVPVGRPEADFVARALLRLAYVEGATVAAMPLPLQLRVEQPPDDIVVVIRGGLLTVAGVERAAGRSFRLVGLLGISV